jgi:fatty acid desaturase
MARHQLSLAILMHDAAHRRLFNNLAINDYVAQFFFASPILFSLNSYRVFHLKHHQDPLAPEDPDLSLIGGYPIPKASLLRKLLRDASGVSYFKFIKYFISKSRTQQGRKVKSDGKRVGPSFAQVILMTLFTNGLIFSALYALGHAWYYLLFWLIPAMTALQVLLRIRGIAEHAGYEQNSDQRLNARTVVNPLQAFFFAPNRVNFHVEHHVYPSIPWYHLPQVHKLMKERGSLPEKNVFRGYGAVIRELVT